MMTRDEILDAAAHIFSQKGFHATSMKDIAEAVNLQKGSLYHHIDSKQQILEAVLNRALDLLIERMQSVVKLRLPPDQKLSLAMQVYLKTLLDNQELAAVLLLEHRSLEPDLHARHIPRRDQFERLWRDLIQEGMSAGVFCCTDPAFVSRSLLGALNWTINWFRPDGPLSAEKIAELYAELFLMGLLARTEDA